MNKPKIIYVIGAGRSGTTLLDIALGNAVGVRSCGELNRYPVRDGIPTSFDLDSERIAFWRTFTGDFSQRYDLPRQAGLHDEFEYHKGLLKRLMGRKNETTFREYQQYLRDFYAEIFARIDEPVIVDSSKYPGRALSLSETLSDAYDIAYVYIKRDPIGVVKSFAKTDVYLPPKSFWEANLYYFLVNNLCKWVLRRLKRQHRVIEITYEDLIHDPVALLNDIQGALNVDLSAAISKIANDEYLTVGELFEGNSMRIKPQIKLRRSKKPQPQTFRDNLTRVLNYRIYH